MRTGRALLTTSGALTLGLGVMMLGGWAYATTFGNDTAREGGYLDTALCLLMLGAGSVWVARPSPRYAQVVPILAAVLAVISLAERVTGRDLHPLSLIFPAVVFSPSSAARDVPPATAAAFLLVAVAQAVLLAGRSRPGNAVAQSFATSGAVVGLFGCYGLLYQVPSLAAETGYRGVALSAAVAVLSMALALILGGPGTSLSWVLTDGTVSGMLTRRVLASALITLPLVGWLLLRFQERHVYGAHFGYGLLVVATVALVVSVGLVTGGRAARMEAADAAARVQLREHAQLDVVLRNTPMAFAIKALDGRYELASVAYERMYGVPPGTTVGRLDSELHTSADLVEIVRRDRAVLAADEPVVIEHEVGAHTYVTTTFAMHDEAGEPFAICSLANDITALRAAEDLLGVRQSNDAQLAAIVGASSDAIVSKTLDGTIQTWNPGAERLYGHTAAEMVGRDVSVILPADRPDEERALLDRVRRGETVKHHETARMTKDGGIIFVSLSMAPVRDETGTIVGACTISHDITAEVEAEKRLRVEREQFRLIMTAASDPFVSMDEHGLITEWNRQAEQVFGWTREEAVGRHVYDTVLPPRYAAPLLRVLGGTWDWLLDRPTELYARRRDGSEVPIELTMWRLGKRPFTYHAFARDITARRQTAVALAQARDQAVEAARLKSQFLASMSHEIRTPMNGVIGLSGLLLGTTLDHTQRRYAEGINSAGVALLSVINDILDFSKLEAGKVQLDEVGFDMWRLLDNVVSLVTGTGVSVKAVCDPALSAPMHGDLGKLRQVLVNLAGNAVKFTPEGEVVVSASVLSADESVLGESVLGESVLDENVLQVRFEVRDTGIGIDPDKQHQLFEPFVQADAGTTRRFGGTGLGLAISRDLVGVLGGEITLSSRPGEGSTFSFTVPLRRASSEAPASVIARAPIPSGHGHVLLVEDNDINQTVALGILANLGYTADVAVNGREAVAMADRQDYQAIFMDCLMPEMDGYEATAEIRRHENGNGRHIPIIAMTAGAMAEDRARCLASGMDDHLAKPLMPDDVAYALDGWVGSRPEPAEADPSVTAEIENRLTLLRGAGPALDGDALGSLVGRLAAQTPRLLHEIAQALAMDDVTGLRDKAHQLKGVAANLGVTVLAGACDRMERAARSADLEDALVAVTDVRSEARRMLAAVAAVSARLESPA